jgi:hypothetical protein
MASTAATTTTVRRFRVGDIVLASVGGGVYKQGTIIKLEDAGKPYRIKLKDEIGTEVWAPADDDTYVKAATPEAVAAAEAAAAAVLCPPVGTKSTFGAKGGGMKAHPAGCICCAPEGDLEMSNPALVRCHFCVRVWKYCVLVCRVVHSGCCCCCTPLPFPHPFATLNALPHQLVAGISGSPLLCRWPRTLA